MGSMAPGRCMSVLLNLFLIIPVYRTCDNPFKKRLRERRDESINDLERYGGGFTFI